jgi:hypothetical protein
MHKSQDIFTWAGCMPKNCMFGSVYSNRKGTMSPQASHRRCSSDSFLWRRCWSSGDRWCAVIGPYDCWMSWPRRGHFTGESGPYHTPMTLVHQIGKQVPQFLNVTGLLQTPLPPPELLEKYREMLERNCEDDHRVGLSPRIRRIRGRAL